MTMNVRNRRVVKKIDLTGGVGLELGPLTAPVIKKTEGNIFYLDHMSQTELKNKYKDEPVDPDKIVPVDYVLNRTLKETVKDKKFDYVIASHVIEHIPDTISWLYDVSSILKQGGVLSLVIPDKRFTFDIDRSPTRPADVIGAYIDKLDLPSSATMYDYASLYAENIDTASVWNDPDYYIKLPPKRRWNNIEAMDMVVRGEKGEYIDCHCSVYTPASFVKILRELTENDLIDFEVCSFLETQEYELEFFVSLKKVDKNYSKQSRLRTLPKINETLRIDKESREAIKQSVFFEKELESVRNSLSWKITKPLREVKILIRDKLKN